MSVLLTPRTIASLVKVATSARQGVCTIITPDDTRVNGAPTRGTPTSQQVACYFWTAGGDEASGDELAQKGRYRIDVAAETAITSDCTVVYLGVSYRVLWAPPPYEAGRIVGLTEGGAVYAIPVPSTGWALDFSQAGNSGYLGAM